MAGILTLQTQACADHELKMKGVATRVRTPAICLPVHDPGHGADSQDTLFVHCNGVPTSRFKEKRKRIKADSPHGQRPGWDARPIIVKSGDDCRQELLAAQLISAFHDIFQARVPTYSSALHPGYWQSACNGLFCK